jgi:hypothetical protein
VGVVEELKQALVRDHRGHSGQPRESPSRGQPNAGCRDALQGDSEFGRITATFTHLWD